jgi:hypothetical protein
VKVKDGEWVDGRFKLMRCRRQDDDSDDMSEASSETISDLDDIEPGWEPQPIAASQNQSVAKWYDETEEEGSEHSCVTRFNIKIDLDKC